MKIFIDILNVFLSAFGIQLPVPKLPALLGGDLIPTKKPMNPNDELVTRALEKVGVTEVGGDNKGKDVEEFQKAVDGIAAGESWCMAFVQYLIKKVEASTGASTEIFRDPDGGEHVLTVWNKTPASMKSKTPLPGSVWCVNVPGTTKGHTGIVRQINKDGTIMTIEGNTTAKGAREGDGKTPDGVCIQPARVINFESKTWRTLGFIRVFPDEIT